MVLYELDLGFWLPSSPLEGSDLELLKQKLRGVLSALESQPLALLVTVHLGRPEPDGEDEEPSLQGRLKSLPSSEVLLDALREVVGPSASSVEPFGAHLKSVEAIERGAEVRTARDAGRARVCSEGQDLAVDVPRRLF